MARYGLMETADPEATTSLRKSSIAQLHSAAAEEWQAVPTVEITGWMSVFSTVWSLLKINKKETQDPDCSVRFSSVPH